MDTSKFVFKNTTDKTYSVLLKFENGTDKKVNIDARTENDARWIGKKTQGVYDATVLNRVRN
ncbi:MAG: hypothetical protein H7325_09660 [Pedobacter sp.]|nr:hypothetical protein [Pedobacter sp.]